MIVLYQTNKAEPDEMLRVSALSLYRTGFSGVCFIANSHPNPKVETFHKIGISVLHIDNPIPDNYANNGFGSYVYNKHLVPRQHKGLSNEPILYVDTDTIFYTNPETIEFDPKLPVYARSFFWSTKYRPAIRAEKGWQYDVNGGVLLFTKGKFLDILPDDLNVLKQYPNNDEECLMEKYYGDIGELGWKWNYCETHIYRKDAHLVHHLGRRHFSHAHGHASAEALLKHYADLPIINTDKQPTPQMELKSLFGVGEITSIGNLGWCVLPYQKHHVLDYYDLYLETLK